MSRTDELRALSVRQPWAYAILHLGKDVENRPWRTHYRGRILIQAALRIEREEALRLKLDPDDLTTGAIVGSVEIVDCIDDSNSKWALRGQWHWILRNPRYLAIPILFKGALGFIKVPTTLLTDAQFKNG
ncbi:MAG: ASCH domain-containing protein [Candidatus Binataceae bacterium]